jgi:hypothetical protein
MTLLEKYVIQWTGFPGAPGYTVFYGPTLSAHEADIRNLFQSIKNQFPQTVFWKYPSNGFIINDATGVATGTWSTAGQADSQGSDVGSYAAASGAATTWNTSGINAHGHRVKGRTFWVPMAGSAFDTDGTLKSATMTAWLAAHNAFLTAVSGHFSVWTRPIGGSGGTSNPVNGFSLPDRAAVLRSRRA